MASQPHHEIVIVGGNFSGVNLAHYLLRITFPALKKAYPSLTYHITLVSPNTHFFFKIASPRAIVDPVQASNEKIFKSLADAFKQYKDGLFYHVKGRAIAVKATEKNVVVQTDESNLDIAYDSLVIASGTTSTSPLWTLHDDHERSASAIKVLHKALPKATTVLIAGAGPVGVEVAGEIASTLPLANVTLLSSGGRLLPSLKPSIGAKAQKVLESLGVTIKLNTRLENETADRGVDPILLSDGSAETPDVFINATGPRIINTSWLPQSWLDGKEHVSTRDAYFRVRGDGADNVYAIGDVVSGSKKTAIEVDAMTVTVASSIGVDISKIFGGSPVPSSQGLLSFLNPFTSTSPLGQKGYSPMKDTIIIPMGPNAGVGQVMGFPALSFMVKKAKGDNYLMELIEPFVSGEKWKGK
ncbi:FAD/NAD(P)-binding domain-containing protein [Massarina eburnea CBS 473.64]|uniref:FAD/NAD(P)-binding domain-containing protein n=1 Tax=Massarina eburnea CBS 473.64 TaxID=1395130 RepID=A0A6A6RJ05_9PLEO|nr:FAD/NAD(P)-binding domain-containing protein [Massarina eburnea CBS 473.64]